MRRSYLVEYTVLLIICFFSVRACVSEKQANTDLKSENSAISDSTQRYKEKYGQEHAEKQALLDTIQHTTDSFAHVLAAWCKQIQDLPLSAGENVRVQTDTFHAGNKDIIRFSYGDRWISATGLLVLAFSPGNTATNSNIMAGNMLKQMPGNCSTCHRNEDSDCLYDCIR